MRKNLVCLCLLTTILAGGCTWQQVATGMGAVAALGTVAVFAHTQHAYKNRHETMQGPFTVNDAGIDEGPELNGADCTGDVYVMLTTGDRWDGKDMCPELREKILRSPAEVREGHQVGIKTMPNGKKMLCSWGR